MSDGTTDELDRLRLRLDRERRARRQAEEIAERGMRELWQTNSELRERVGRRSAACEHLAAALELAEAARLGVIDVLLRALPPANDEPTLAQLRQLVEVPAVDLDAVAPRCDRFEVADRLLDRWQKRAARRGQLLSVDVGGSGGSTDADASVQTWIRAVAVADTLVGGAVRLGAPGSLRLGVEAGPDAVAVTVDVAGLRDGAVDAVAALAGELAVAARLAGSVGGQVNAFEDPAAGLRIVAVLPARALTPSS